jgi:hypothetical protein
MIHQLARLSTVRLMPACALLAACSGNVVIMGENADGEDDSFVPPPHSRCVGDRTLAGDVEIRTQVDLDVLEGCTSIDGHLVVQPLFDPDLRPLHRLRVVRGELGLGGSTVGAFQTQTAEDSALARDTAAAGFLHSLAGLERLEAVGSLSLVGVAAGSLEPLAQLRQLTDFGLLAISRCDALVDLAPLAQLSGIQRLSLVESNLESLDGLQIRDRLVSLSLSGERLSNIGALSRLRSVSDDISIDQTALRDLAPLAQLEATGGLYISNNPLLETLHGLEALGSVQDYLVVSNNAALQDAAALNGLGMSEFLIVSYNDSLRRLADFPNLRTNSIQITDNPELEALPLLQGTFYAYSRRTAVEVLLKARGQVEISRNASLQRFTVPAEWIGGVYVIIRENQGLRELDLGDLKTLDLLEISQNPALDTLHLGALASVDTLEVVDNPLLLPTAFDTLQTFERRMSGNAP